MVANILAEQLNLLLEGDEILIGEIWYGSYYHTNQTAKIVYDTLKKKVNKFQLKELRECKALDPDSFSLTKDTQERQKNANGC